MELPGKYPQEHYDRKAQRYARTLKLLCGVQVDSSTRDRWSSVISFARRIDTYLDENDRNDLPKRTEHIKQLLNNPNEVTQQYPALSPQELGNKGYARLQKAGISIIEINMDIKSTTSVARYATLRREEGETYAYLITGLATSDVASQPGYDRFVRYLPRVGQVTNLLNSLCNIRRDYQRGELALTPDRATYPRLLGHICVALTEPRSYPDTIEDHF